jgi:hypothetical protein
MYRILALVVGIIILLLLSRSEGFADADPCAGLTDTSPASSVSPACLQKDISGYGMQYNRNGLSS